VTRRCVPRKRGFILKEYGSEKYRIDVYVYVTGHLSQPVHSGFSEHSKRVTHVRESTLVFLRNVP